jgi:dihydroneopterin aldolase
VNRDKIVLSGLEFFGHHGVAAEEKKMGARYVVDVELELPLQGIPDRLDATVDYGAVFESVRSEVAAERCYLIEALGNRIADRIFREHPRLEAVTVRVHKPHAPLPGVFRDVYAQVQRRR